MNAIQPNLHTIKKMLRIFSLEEKHKKPSFLLFTIHIVLMKYFISNFQFLLPQFKELVFTLYIHSLQTETHLLLVQITIHKVNMFKLFTF